VTSGDAVRKVVTDAVTAGVNAGMAVTQTARARAEELLERGRDNTEHLAALVRREIAAQLASMRLATPADLADLEARLREERAAPGPEAPPPTPRPAGRRPAAKKAPAPPPPGTAARRRPPAGPQP